MLHAATNSTLLEDMEVDNSSAASPVPTKRYRIKRKQEYIEIDNGVSPMQEEEPRLPSFEETFVQSSTQEDASDARDRKRHKPLANVAATAANMPPHRKHRSASNKTNKKKNKGTSRRNRKAATPAAQTARLDGDQQPASHPSHNRVNEQSPAAPPRLKRKLESPQMDGALPPLQEDTLIVNSNAIHAAVPLEAAPDVSNTASANKRPRRLSDGNVAEPVTHKEPLASSDKENSAPVTLQAAPADRPPMTLRRSLRILERRIKERQEASKDPRPTELPASDKEASAASSDQTTCLNREQPARQPAQDLVNDYEQSPVCQPIREHSEHSTDFNAPVAPPPPAKREEAELLNGSAHDAAVPVLQEGQCKPAGVPQECSNAAEDEAESARLRANYLYRRSIFLQKQAPLLRKVKEVQIKKALLREQLISLKEIANNHGILGVFLQTGLCRCPCAICTCSSDAGDTTACGGCGDVPAPTEEEEEVTEDAAAEASVAKKEDINKLGPKVVAAAKSTLSELEKLRLDIKEKLKRHRANLQTLQITQKDSLHDLFQYHDFVSALLQLLGEFGLIHLAGLSPAKLEVEATFAHWYTEQQPADVAQPAVSVVSGIQEDGTTEVTSQ